MASATDVVLHELDLSLADLSLKVRGTRRSFWVLRTISRSVTSSCSPFLKRVLKVIQLMGPSLKGKTIPKQTMALEVWRKPSKFRLVLSF